ncbi:ADP-ribosylation factor family-domain-containing protein [Gautieria morchelliformis]|nr:ADP-ribosylation factor family-domain-containing protein [Gautieria morchelliformis]
MQNQTPTRIGFRWGILVTPPMGGVVSHLWAKYETYGVKDIVVFGVNCAGKKSIFTSITAREGRLVLPTDGYNQSIYLYQKKYRFILWDLYYMEGTIFKYTWPDYLPSSPHAAILVIDASNPETFSNTRKVLHELCAHQALSRCPVLVFANKSDVPNCMTVEKVHAGLNLSSLGQLGRKSAVFRCSVTQRFGIHQGMEWLVDNLEPPAGTKAS